MTLARSSCLGKFGGNGDGCSGSSAGRQRRVSCWKVVEDCKLFEGRCRKV